VSGASPYGVHDQPVPVEGLNAREQQGEGLFLQNCAFCHAKDGTGRNWIGSFLQPHPRDLTDSQAMAGVNRHRLKQVISEGLPGTTMSAWKQVLSEQEIDAIVAYIDRAFGLTPVR
jgi:cytochrome c oxidase cbb3-type subunit 3